MDIIELFTRGLDIKTHSRDPEIRALTSDQVLKAIQRHMRQSENTSQKRAGKKVYNDPTATTAIHNVEVRNVQRNKTL